MPDPLTSLIGNIANTLRSIADWLNNFTTPDLDAPIIAAFRLEDISSSENTTDNYLQILADNYKVNLLREEIDPSSRIPPERITNTAYTTVGWMFHFIPSPVGSNRSENINQINQITVSQIVVGIGISPGHDISIFQISLENKLERLTPEGLRSLTEEDRQSKPMFMHKLATPTDIDSLRYVNTLQRADQDTLVDQLEYYNNSTEAVFFSRTQLFLMQKWIKRLRSFPDDYQDVDVVFSGAQMNLGRLSAFSNMLELEVMNNSLPREDLSSWFTLKAEIVPKGEIDNDFPDTTYANNLLEFSNELADIQNDAQAKDLLNTIQCDLINNTDFDSPQGRAPILFTGLSCPLAWQISTAILSEVWNLIEDDDLDNADLKLSLCSILKDIRSDFSNESAHGGN